MERHMKWPNTLTAIRHGESAYNVLKAQKNEDPLYQEFKKAFNRRQKDPERARQLAQEFIDLGSFVLGVGDHGTPLTERGKLQAEITGSKLKHRIDLPDVLLVSPYDRTQETLDQMKKGWPELADVKEVVEDRICEQQHGLALLYNDWKIFHALHPEQEALYNMEGRYWYRYPQGENVPDVRERMRSEMIAVTRDYHERDVLMVTHHLSILALRANMERLDAAGFCDLDEHDKPRNCSLTIYRGYPDLGENGKLLLDTYNEILYPDDLAA